MPPLAAVTCLLCVAAAAPEAQKPDVFDPKHWDQLLDSGDTNARREELKRLRRYQSDRRLPALREPLLRAMTRDPDPLVRALAADVVALNKGYFQAEAELGAAVPSLAKLLDDKDPEARRVATRAIAEIGGDALAALVPLLARGDGRADGELLQLFRNGQEKTCPATIAALSQLASRDDRRTVIVASCAAGEVRSGCLAQLPLAERNVEWCIEGLRDPHDPQGLGLAALNAYGPRGAPAIPAVIEWYLRGIAQAEGKGKDKEEEAEMPGLYTLSEPRRGERK
jgi:hypothetical protein